MVKKNKGWPLFLLIFVVCLNSPAYSANKTIKYLPVNQDADTVNGDYSQGPIELTETVTNNSSCACSEKFAEADRCDNCVSLQEECPDCCLSSDKTAEKCTKGEDNKYDCKTKPFSTDSCDKVICDYIESDDDNTSSTCGANCKPYEDDDNNYQGCDRAKCKDGAVTSGSPYGLERRGCPEPDSQDLAPDGSCELLNSETGLDRKWKCPGANSGNLLPKFGGCSPDPASGLSKPAADYYEVTLATPSCVYGGCSTGSCGGCSTGYPTCSSGPSCEPPCSVGCPKQCTPSCFNTSCISGSGPQPCIDYTNPCTYECRANMCSPGCGSQCSTCSGTAPCTPSCWCVSYPCSSSCLSGNHCIPEEPFYIYVFTQAFKDYINRCVPYADEYEQCQDRIKCCQENVCSDELEDTDYASKCDDDSCQERFKDTSGACDAYSDAQQCAQLLASAEACLLDTSKGKGPSCYKEINPDFHFDFVAKSNETYNINWQIASEMSYTNERYKKIKKETAKLYTMVKIVDPVDESIVYYPGEKPPLNSYMLQVKGLNAAFSIYGLTQVTGLTAGKAYRIRLYYYRTENRKNSEGTEVPGTTIKVKKMSLIVLRTRQ